MADSRREREDREGGRLEVERAADQGNKEKRQKQRSASVQEEWAPVHERREPIGALMQPKVGGRGGQSDES